MKDEDKTREQLIDELQSMRARLTELEKSRIQNKGMAESEERLRLVLEATKDGIWDWNTRTGLSYFSPRYYTMLGYDEGEFPPTYESFRRLIHPDDLKETERVVQNAAEKHLSYAVEFRMKAKNGAWRWILSRGEALEQDSEGRSTRMVGSHTDITKRKEIEQSLRLAHSIIDKANMGIYLISPEGRIEDVNSRASELLGYTREELETLSISDIDPLIKRITWGTNWQELIKQDSRILEREHRKKDGSLIPVEIHSNLLKHNDRLYGVAFVQDISERRKHEEALREKDRLLYEIGRLVKIGAWRFDVETGESQWTDEVFRIYDLDLEGDYGRDIGLSCFHGENRRIIEKAFDDAVKYGTPYDLELEMISAKGIRKWVRTFCDPVVEKGRVVKMQGSFQDITAIKQGELQLKESEGKYRALIELSPLGIGIVNMEGVVVDGNQALASMLGYETDELLGLELAEITHPDDVDRENELLQTLRKGEGASYSFEKRYRHRDGHFFWVNITTSIAEDICGPGTFFFGFAEDISARKKMELEREELINDLQTALDEIKELREFIPICANCKKIRDDDGYWQHVEQYITDKTAAQFSHSLCPECAHKLYPHIHKKKETT